MPRPYTHLDLEERRKFAKWREAGIPMKEIADRLPTIPKNTTSFASPYSMAIETTDQPVGPGSELPIEVPHLAAPPMVPEKA